ncbi:unnamed protein product [Tilletia controversa]|nr:unnamed protein product [Tilletia controversa]
MASSFHFSLEPSTNILRSQVARSSQRRLSIFQKRQHGQDTHTVNRRRAQDATVRHQEVVVRYSRAELPGEIVLLIMQHVFDRNPKRDQTLKQYIRSTIGVQLLSWKVKLAVDTVIGFHFHAFPRPIHHGVHDCQAPFHPSVHAPVQTHRVYWDFFQGTEASRIPDLYELQQSLTRARLPLLRCVSIDLRAHEPITRSSLRLWKTMHAPRWVLSTTVLARMSVASYGIEEFHVRLTAQQNHIDLVEEIVANNTNLRVIHIEVDSAVGGC